MNCRKNTAGLHLSVSQEPEAFGPGRPYTQLHLHSAIFISVLFKRYKRRGSEVPTLAQGHTVGQYRVRPGSRVPWILRHELIPQKKSLRAQAALPPLPGWVDSRQVEQHRSLIRNCRGAGTRGALLAH